VFQLDVNLAFPHDELDEKVCVVQPQEYVKEGHEHKIYKLNKAIYDPKQAWRFSNSRIDRYSLQIGL